MKNDEMILLSGKYNSNIEVDEDELCGVCSTNGVKKNAQKSLERKRPIYTRVHNIKMDLGEGKWSCMYYCCLAETGISGELL